MVHKFFASLSEASHRAGTSKFVSVPSEIKRAGVTLARVASGSDTARTYSQVEGVGDYTNVAGAVAVMLESWDPALDQWAVNLATVGTATGNCGDDISSTDEQLSVAWSTTPQPTQNPMP